MAEYLKKFLERWQPDNNTTGMPKSASPFNQRCFVVGTGGALNDVEMVHCDCGMWNALGHVCPCKWLGPSSLAEEEHEAILEPEPEETEPCPCLRICPADSIHRMSSKFACCICGGSLVVPKKSS